ncbi:MAG: L-histidine N(alpha)-methyltransferase [Heteroscytonema crispum UTEX LB 1556]
MLEKFEKVYVHPSQFSGRVYQDYLSGFSLKQINHKFHYDSFKQSQKWLKIHEEFSPARRDDNCIDAYAKCFQQTAEILDGISVAAPQEHPSSLNLISLGCGGGEKDKLLVSHIFNTERALTYYPVDVSLSLAIISAQKVRAAFANLSVHPVVCDLLQSNDLISLINDKEKETRNIITFFGMIPNFYPDEILPILSNFLEQGDFLLFSANLAPGSDYIQGIQKVLPQYDNELTKEWLITVLLDAGVEREDGTIQFQIEQDSQNQQFQRIAAYFELKKDVSLKFEDELIEWKNGERIRLFFSYRYTTPTIKEMLKSYGIDVLNYWEPASQEEGVYLCQKV